jgi:N-acetylmuramic acid 6-phosphate etherase
MLNTETPNSEHPDLDLYATAELLDAFVADQRRAVEAVQAATPQLEAAVEAALPRLRAGGRLLYAGAGTSGRLGVLDSVELPPTFSWPRERAVAVLAGGRGAMFEAVEGAEDATLLGAADIAALEPGPNDVLIGIAASGSTPYVLGALAAGRAAGALTIGIANNPGSELAQEAEIGIVLDTGPEVISGSTRLKAGTAQKIALNTLSSALMVRLHKVYGNLMVDLKATNAKLRRRALALTVRATGASETQAAKVLTQCDQHVKTAVVAIRLGISVADARTRLAVSDGSVRGALA